MPIKIWGAQLESSVGGDARASGLALGHRKEELDAPPWIVILHLDLIQAWMKLSLIVMIFRGKTQNMLSINLLLVYPMMIWMKSSPVGLMAKKPVILMLMHPLRPS